MARRGGLFGDAERESRLSQQRDYAAQLQEQVRAKQAQAEQDKVRRRHEQQREREQLDAAVAQQQTQAQRARAPPPVQTDAPPLAQQQPPPPPAAPVATSPSRSPMRGSPPPTFGFQPHAPPPDHEIHHGSALLPPSPLRYGEQLTANAMSFGSAAAAASLSPLVATFAPGPSIFDSLLQSESDRLLTNQIEALQSLRLDLEATWKQRRAAMQAITTKPQFIIVPSPTASASIPLSFDEKRELDEEIDLGTPREDQAELYQDRQDDEELGLTSGLLGESVLIPLTHASPAKCATDAASVSPQRLVPSSPPRSNSAVHRRLAAALTHADTTPSAFATNSSALRHDSELLHFDQ